VNSLIDLEDKRLNGRGIFLHPTFVMTPSRECFGIIDYEQWAREKHTDQTPEERKAQRYLKPIKNKESYRWVRGYKNANKLSKAMPSTHFVYVADREGDIYDIYHEAQAINARASWVIRAIFDRSGLDENCPKKRNQLKTIAKENPPIGNVNFMMSSLENRKKQKLRKKYM
jgi:hypothetical protein